jgi:hypothetical protein
VTGDITFTPQSGFTGDPTPISYTVEDAEGNTSNPATVTITYIHPPDITPNITADPNVMHGVTNFDIIVQVTELLNYPTNGLITVLIPKDNRWSFTYNPSATDINGKPVNNPVWTWTDFGIYHKFTTSSVITAGYYSRFGFTALWTEITSMGTYTITSQITSGSGGETRIDNNVDAEKLDYFIN